MSPELLAGAGVVVSILVNVGLLVLAKRALAALILQELSNHFPKKGDVDRDLIGMGRRVDRSEAAATLAIENADRALGEAKEVRSLLERHHERVLQDFVRPLEEQTRVLQDMGKALASHATQMENQGTLLQKLLDKELKL